MPRVKILEIFEHTYHNDDYGDHYYSLGDTTEWDDVTDEQLENLKKWAHDKNSQYNIKSKIVVVTEKEVDIPKTIKEFLAKIERDVKEQQEKEQKQKEAVTKRLKTLESKKKEKEKKLLKELQKKYDSSGQSYSEP